MLSVTNLFLFPFYLKDYRQFFSHAQFDPSSPVIYVIILILKTLVKSSVIY